MLARIAMGDCLRAAALTLQIILPVLLLTAVQAEASETIRAETQVAQAQMAQAQVAQASAASSGPGGGLDPDTIYLLESTQGAEPPRALIEQLYDDPDNALSIMASFLVPGDISPEERAKRAVSMARGIVNSRRGIADPETRDHLIGVLMRLASEVICSTGCVGTEIANDYRPDPSSFAFDYGGPASLLAPGFTLVTPDSDMFSGGPLQAMDGLGTGALLIDAISGMDQITFFVPNGSYVLRLYVPEGGSGQIFTMRVNGMTHWVAWPGAGEWPVGTPLVTPINQSTTGSGTPVGGYACKMAMGVRVPAGIVTLEFEEQPTPFPISGMELLLNDPLLDGIDEDGCLRWDGAQRNAILVVLDEGPGNSTTPPITPPTTCTAGACPVDPIDPSPAGAT